jgi:probable HAF family extracellular repeat protein
MTGLGELPGGRFISQAFGVSPDGSVVVGYDESASGIEAFRWTEPNGMVGLGDLLGGMFYSEVFGVSEDGQVVVGESHSASGYEAIRWHDINGNGIVDPDERLENHPEFGLGDLPGGKFQGWAVAASADGSVVVGSGHSASGYEAFRWTQESGMVGLGDLPGGKFQGLATSVSADGSVVVGYGESASGTEAFCWEDTNGNGQSDPGEMQGLGDMSGGTFRSVAQDTSADGSIIVGYGTSESGREVFIWDTNNGMRNLKGVLQSEYGLDLTGWTLTEATAISDDGLTIVGSGTNPDGHAEAWIATLCPPPEPPCELIPEEIASMDVGHSGAGVVSYDGKLYVWTGYTNYGPTHYNRTAKMEIYDPDANTWSDGADIPQLKSLPACFELNGKFYTVGGETNPSGSFTNTVHRYDPDTDTWVHMNNFPRRIWQGQAVACCDKAYVFGGATGYGNPLSSLYEYDEASDAWIPKAPMLTGVSHPAAVCFDNKIWVFGGVASFHPTMITKEIQIYDPSANTWESGGDIPWKLNGMQAIVYNNDIWIFASSLYDEGTGDWVDNEYAYQFSPETSEWTRHPFPRTLTPPIEPYYDSKLALINGYVYLTHTYDTTTHENSERAFKVKICELALTVAVDIKPQSCPNPLNVDSKGMLPVAILGSADFDVNTVDVNSIELAGVQPIRSSLEDVAMPVSDGNECDCNAAGPDGHTDLTLKFKTQEIVNALGEVVDGEVLKLTLTGELLDGTTIEGMDCIVILHKGKKG